MTIIIILIFISITVLIGCAKQPQGHTLTIEEKEQMGRPNYNDLENAEDTEETTEDTTVQSDSQMWTEEDFEGTFDNMNNAKTEQIELMNPKDTIPLYNGQETLIYFIWYNGELTYPEIKNVLCYTFDQGLNDTHLFRDVFIYDNDSMIAKGARTYDKHGLVIAEARYISQIDQGKIEVEEFQYIPNSGTEGSYKKIKDIYFRELNGKLVFKCKSEYWDGHKVREYDQWGEKLGDFYWLWPVGY